MKWIIKHEPEKKAAPWSVYEKSTSVGTDVYRIGFKDKAQAEMWIKDKDSSAVEEASMESFPASDPPSSTGSTVKH